MRVLDAVGHLAGPVLDTDEVFQGSCLNLKKKPDWQGPGDCWGLSEPHLQFCGTVLGWGVVRDRDWGLYSTLPFVPVLLTKQPSW